MDVLWYLLGTVLDSQFTCLWSPWPFAQLKLLLRRPTPHAHLGSSIIWSIQKKKYGFLFFLKKKSTRPGVWITQSESLKLETKLSVILQAPEIKIIQ